MPVSRYDRERALTEFPEEIVDSLERYLLKGDPLGDQVAAELNTKEKWEKFEQLLRDPAAAAKLRSTYRDTFGDSVFELLEQVSTIPTWLDRSAFPIASRVFFRSGELGGTSLAFRSLLGGYISPAGNKPLVFTGRLERDTPRRLVETARFTVSIYEDGGLKLGAPGFRSAIKVRLMHSSVRHRLWANDGAGKFPKWDEQEWGHPINQYDMAATILLFSTVFIDGLKSLGARFTREEEEAVQHTWRYVGLLMGVDRDLLATTYREGQRLFKHVLLAERRPDDDSRMLTEALLRAPIEAAKTERERRRMTRNRPVLLALARRMLGPEAASSIGVEEPTAVTAAVTRALLKAIRGMERARERSPLIGRWAESKGRAYWKNAIEGRGEQFGDFWSFLPRTQVEGRERRGATGAR